MRDLLPPLFLAALCGGFLLLTSPAWSQEAACHPLPMVEGWLRSEGYTLDDWGLQDGEEHQLWLGPRGWAVVAVDAHKCARVVSLPDAPRARLGGTAG